MRLRKVENVVSTLNLFCDDFHMSTVQIKWFGSWVKRVIWFLNLFGYVNICSQQKIWWVYGRLRRLSWFWIYLVTIYVFPHVFRKEAVTRPEKDPKDVSYNTSPMRFQQTAFFTMVSRRRKGHYFGFNSLWKDINFMSVQSTVQVELEGFNPKKVALRLI